MKKLISAAFASCLSLALLSGCTPSSKTTTETETKKTYKISMVADTGGVQDHSFNQSALEGLQRLKKEEPKTITYNYKEPKQSSDYVPYLQDLADEKSNLVFGIGFAMASAIAETAKKNPEISFVLVDNAVENPTSNLTGISFRSEEPSFLVGYIAAKTSKTGKVGFVGGMKSSVISQFEFGYKAGVAYAAKEIGKKVDVIAQYAETFADASKGKTIGSKLLAENCDVIFHASGNTGMGVIEAVKEAGKGKFAIGVDRDQSEVAPDNILTSAIKNVGQAVMHMSREFIAGGSDKIGGRNYEYGVAEGCLDIPSENKNLDQEIYKAAMALKRKIIDKQITVPKDEATYKDFISKL